MPKTYSHALVVLIDHFMVPLHFEQAIFRKAGLRHEFPRSPEPAQLRFAILCARLENFLDRIFHTRSSVMMDLASRRDEVGFALKKFLLDCLCPGDPCTPAAFPHPVIP
jgi:hypothetical protein